MVRARQRAADALSVPADFKRGSPPCISNARVGSKHASRNVRIGASSYLFAGCLKRDRGRPVPKISLPCLRCLAEPLLDEPDVKVIPARFQSWSRWKRGRRREEVMRDQHDAAA